LSLYCILIDERLAHSLTNFCAGTATDGEDYTISTTSLHFADAEVTKEVVLTFSDDSVYEGTENILVNFGTLVNCEVGRVDQLEVILIDNDPVVKFSELVLTEDEHSGVVDVVIIETNMISQLDAIIDLTITGTAERGYVCLYILQILKSPT
jgi:hypothetical protein